MSGPTTVARPGSGEEPEDFVLIRRFLQSGEPALFRALVERHLPPIRRLLYTIFNGQREEMEDAEQDIVLALFQKLKGFEFRSSFRTYLYSLARNRAVDRLRKMRRQEGLLARLKPGWWNRAAAGPEELLLKQEQSEDLLGVFRALPGKDRQLILMKDVDGFSLEEIARMLDIPVGTVKSRLHRAREKLAGLLGERG